MCAQTGIVEHERDLAAAERSNPATPRAAWIAVRRPIFGRSAVFCTVPSRSIVSTRACHSSISQSTTEPSVIPGKFRLVPLFHNAKIGTDSAKRGNESIVWRSFGEDPLAAACHPGISAFGIVKSLPDSCFGLHNTKLSGVLPRSALD